MMARTLLTRKYLGMALMTIGNLMQGGTIYYYFIYFNYVSLIKILMGNDI